jgi:CheY-like chemotaxis protein
LDTNQLRVLIVDDDPIVLEVTRERLVAAGYDVMVRESPVGTAAAIQREQVDIVILDVLMPGLRGDELARLLKKNPATARTAILLHSSLHGDELRPLIMSTGALGAIEKSWSTAEFHSEFARIASRVRTLRSAPVGDPQSASFRIQEELPASSRGESAPPSTEPRSAQGPSSGTRAIAIRTSADVARETTTILERIRSRFK